MASAKETPRQKLIGIMYLILLALLALQVSSSVMEKFRLLDDNMQFTNAKMDQNTQLLGLSIEKNVSQLGNKASDVALLEKSKLVRSEAESVRKYINQLREQIVKETGGFEDEKDPKSMYKGAKDEGKIEDLMIGAKKATELQKSVNGFCAKLRQITGQQVFSNLALDPIDDTRIPKSSDQKHKTFAEYNFAATPMVAAMAVLSNIESDVIKYELQALEDINKQIGGYIITVDQIKPMYRANANTVVAGTKYTAELFLGATSSTAKPMIVANGQNLSVNGDGIGKLEFLASGGGYNEFGLAKKKWTGKITFKNRGKDTTFAVDGEYNVIKPYVDVQAAAPPSLYRNCANELKVSCPQLGAEFNPNFSGSTGGRVVTSGVPGKITVIPKDPNFALNVTNNGANIDYKKYSVLLVPKPTVRLMNGSTEVDQKNGLRLPLPNSLRITMKADENFLKVCPKDGLFNPTESMVYVIRNKTLLKQFTCKNGVIDLLQVRALGLVSGDRLYIETKKIQRANYNGEIEDVNMSPVIWNVTLVN
jgi:gliding motility-associated protein GldM